MIKAPKLENRNCSLIFSENSTGVIYNSDLTLWTKSDTSPYQIFNNLRDTIVYAEKFVSDNLQFECLIYDSFGDFILKINTENIKVNKKLLEIKTRFDKLQNNNWSAYIEGRDFSSGSSFVMVNNHEERLNDLEILGADDNEVDFIANSKKDIKFLLDEIDRLNKIIFK